MNIIITLAGHSRRFKQHGYNGPKFLIKIDGKTMIEHVLDMFSDSDSFHFVLNSDQLKETPDLDKFLKKISKKSTVTIIEPHEKGPVYTALQVKDINDNEPVIVTYCDFFVMWNYRRFLRDINSYDGAIPSFKGFHPASFGHTYYAYMRTNENYEMLELREKNSFTDRRHEEPASVGIYYFRDWAIFKKYSEELMEKGFENLKEGYVSLLANLMVRDGLKIKLFDVEKFICWGTPEDLEQYLFWSQYFEKYVDISSSPKPVNKRRQINLMPMAGKGSRFKQEGFKASKPLISINNKPMIINACESFPDADSWIFLPRKEDVEKHPIEQTIRKFCDDAIIVPVAGETSGQAATCLIAEKYLDPEASLFIASCDYKTIYDAKKWQEIIDDESIDAVIWTCRLGANLTKNPKAFAYCVTGEDGKTITKIVEKDVISDNPGADPLVVGSFWFRKASDFLDSARTAIEKNINVNGEHYVANSMNLLLGKGKKLVIFDIEKWISFGDPFELDLYYYWEEMFFQKNKIAMYA